MNEGEVVTHQLPHFDVAALHTYHCENGMMHTIMSVTLKNTIGQNATLTFNLLLLGSYFRYVSFSLPGFGTILYLAFRLRFLAAHSHSHSHQGFAGLSSEEGSRGAAAEQQRSARTLLRGPG